MIAMCSFEIGKQFLCREKKGSNYLYKSIHTYMNILNKIKPNLFIIYNVEYPLNNVK